jgi:hypothetical protein
MRFLKSEFGQRSKEAASGCREDDVMYPEQLCDHDILIWRRDEHSYFNYRRDGDKHSWAGEGIDLVRDNDAPGLSRDIHTKSKDMFNLSSMILRTSL